MATVQIDCSTLNECMGDLGGRFEDIAISDEERSIQTHGQCPDAICGSQDLGGR